MPADSIYLGFLHSLSGTMALSEKPLLDAGRMAVAEINAEGGVLGRPLAARVWDGASQPEEFARGAQALIEGGASALFGCWTSASRKAVRPVVEAADHLLWYPVQYEGLEESPCIVYTGSCPNQQIMPAVEWALEACGRRVFLLGSDYVYPRTANQLVRSLVESRGGTIVAEEYVPLGAREFGEVLKRLLAQTPDLVFNTLNGDSNLAFYRQAAAAGLRPSRIPILATSVTETELEPVADVAAGHFACWPYFQSLETPANRRFVRRFQSLYGETRRVSAPTMTAYCQVHLWREAVERAQTVAPRLVRRHAPGCAFAGPPGLLRIEANGHASMPVRIGRLKPNGQFEIVWSREDPLEPLPWLGVERMEFPGKVLALKSMAAFADHVNINVRLEQEILRRRELETALQQANAGLEEKVADRTRQLQQALENLKTEMAEHQRAEEDRRRLQADLAQSQKMESIGRLAGGVAHDFNNMLGVILGYAEIALDRAGVAPDIHGDLQEIRSAAQRSAALTRQLLAFARRQPASPQAFDVNAAVPPMLRMLQRLTGEAVTLHWEPAGEPLWVRMDPAQLDQVLANLCVNARDAVGDTGTVTLTTETATFDAAWCAAHSDFQAGDFVLLAVRDTGRGMTPDVQQHLFEPFFTTKETGHGTGLGLATVYGIIRQNQGFIRVESAPGAGATFRVYLPRIQPPAAAPEEAKSKNHALPGGRETVLIIEDETAIRKLCAGMLAGLGYATLTAGSPPEALQILREQHGAVDLLVVDLVLPEMTGRALAQRIAAEYPKIKRLYMSGYASDLVSDRSHLADGAHFIQKPFSQHELAVRVRAALDES